MPRSPRAACARISARQAPSCARSICNRRCAAGIADSGSFDSRSSASATLRARSRRRSRSVVSQASKVGSMPSRSSSRSPSSNDSEAGWSVVARITSSTSTQAAPGRSDRWSRVTCMISPPAGDSVSSRRWISCRSDARACSSGRRLHSSSASRPRKAGRGADSATTASRARVLRPAGRTFSLVIVQASIWPIKRRRSTTCPEALVCEVWPGGLIVVLTIIALSTSSHLYRKLDQHAKPYDILS